MRDYGQFCPIARSSELLAECWTPVIVRNLLNGCRTHIGCLFHCV
jgi:DNA-binding HxlR family transcriptional regulator